MFWILFFIFGIQSNASATESMTLFRAFRNAQLELLKSTDQTTGPIEKKIQAILYKNLPDHLKTTPITQHACEGMTADWEMNPTNELHVGWHALVYGKNKFCGLKTYGLGLDVVETRAVMFCANEQLAPLATYRGGIASYTLLTLGFSSGVLRSGPGVCLWLGYNHGVVGAMAGYARVDLSARGWTHGEPRPLLKPKPLERDESVDENWNREPEEWDQFLK